MESIYVTKKKEELTYLPLMEKVDTITAVAEKDLRRGDGFYYHMYFVSKKYSVKMRIFDDGFIQASCSCPDYVYRKKEKKEFCKHIYAVLDLMNQKKNE